MTNIDKFIHNAKKKRLKNFIIGIIVIIAFAIFCYFWMHDWFLPIGCLVVGIIVLFYFIYEIHKINHIEDKLTDVEKTLFEKELSSLNFDGANYALTNNYIFDYNKVKLIPISSITAIKKEKSIKTTRNSIDVQFKVKIWVDNEIYTYISKEKSTSIQLSGFQLYYTDLYNYIKERNNNIEER